MATEDPLILVCSTEWDAKWARLVDEHLLAVGLGGKHRLAHLVPDSEGRISHLAARAIDTARLAVLILTQDFLASKHILRDVLPQLVLRASLVVKHGQSGDVEFLPIVAKECPWGQLPETVFVQITPDLQQPLEKREVRDAHKVLFQTVHKAHEYLKRLKALPPDLAWTPPPESALRLEPLGTAVLGRDYQDREQAVHELNVAWMRPTTRVINVVGPSGSGKTTLLTHWLHLLARDKFRGAERVFVWSFDRDRGTGRLTTADQFLHQARASLVLGEQAPLSPWEEGALIARELQTERTLLVLDGVDALLETDEAGSTLIRDQALLFLLRKWLAGDGGLCVVASRQPLADLAAWQGRSLETTRLEPFSPTEGAELLQKMKVPGGLAPLREAAECAKGHALCLRLLGAWLAANFEPTTGRVADTSHFRLLPGDRPLAALLAAYARAVGDGPELRLLRMLALADRPLDPHDVRDCCAGGSLVGITDRVGALDAESLATLTARLRWAGLLMPLPDGQLDAPPLVREHFRTECESQHRDAGQAFHARLFGRLKPASSEAPQSLAELLAALRAFRHGSLGGQTAAAFHDFFLPQIWGPADEHHFTPARLLCARLESLAPLLDEASDLPLEELDPADRQAVFCLWARSLRAAGRFADAAAAKERELLWARNHGQLGQFAECLLELAELLLLLGRAKEATRRVNELFVLPDLQKQPQLFRDTVLLSARILQLKGQFQEALARHRLADTIAAPNTRLLGAKFWNCEAILDAGSFPLAERTAWKQFELLADNNDLAAAGHALVLVRMYFSLRTHSGDWRYREEAGKHLALARRAALRSGLVEGLLPVELATATLHRHEERFPDAVESLIDVTTLAQRHGLKFLELDCHLEAIRLKLAQGIAKGVPQRVAKVRQQVQDALYGRVARDFQQIEKRFVVVRTATRGEERPAPPSKTARSS